MEIVVSDDQGNEEREHICAKCRDGGINIQYEISGRTGIANNLNHCISMPEGNLIKIMLQDDFFIASDALSHIHQTMSHTKSSWLRFCVDLIKTPLLPVQIGQ